jgi:hypothetical protein
MWKHETRSKCPVNNDHKLRTKLYPKNGECDFTDRRNCAGVLVRFAVWLLGEPKLKLRGLLILSLDRNTGLASCFGLCNFGCTAPVTHLAWRIEGYKGMDMSPLFYVKVERALMIDQFPLSRVYEERGCVRDIID